MEKVEGAGVELAYAARGEGPPVLVIHGIASDAAAWEPFAHALADRARVLVYDRRGYGASGRPEVYTGTTVEEQAQDAAAALVALTTSPAVVVGDGFGALVALDVVKRHRALVRAAVLSDPPLFAFVPEATERLAAERVTLEEALRDGGPEEAVAAWLRDRGAPADTIARARRAHNAFFADYAGLTSWAVTRGELRALDAPAVVLTGPRTPSHVLAAADALAGLLPRARRERDGDVTAATAAVLA